MLTIHLFHDEAFSNIRAQGGELINAPYKIVIHMKPAILVAATSRAMLPNTSMIPVEGWVVLD